MSAKKAGKFLQWMAMSAVVSLFFVAFAVAYIRNQTTIIGYHLGELKKKESELIEVKNQLSMELAKHSTKKSLEKLSGVRLDPKKLEKTKNL